MNFFPQVEPGYKITEVPKSVLYLPINIRTIYNITVKIHDQEGRLVNFRGEEIIRRINKNKLEINWRINNKSEIRTEIRIMGLWFGKNNINQRDDFENASVLHASQRTRTCRKGLTLQKNLFLKSIGLKLVKKWTSIWTCYRNLNMKNR